MAQILVIDDEDDIRLLLKARLEFEGYGVLEAQDGNEGLDQAARHRPDLIILDITMPSMNGYQFWNALHKDPQLSQIPIIIFTAKMQANDVFWKQSISTFDYITKTSSINSLLNRIKEKLRDSAKN